jgi:hypothetical protein
MGDVGRLDTSHMIKFIKSLLQGKSAESPPPIPAVELMSFSDVAEHIQRAGEFMTPQQGTALTRRLYEIALYDHDVEKEHRVAALKLLDALKISMESVMTPELIDTYRKANAHMEGNVRRLGIGSLAWLIEEHHVPEGEMIPFIARPEHSPLLDDFFTVLSPANAEAMKVQLERYRTQRT